MNIDDREFDEDWEWHKKEQEKKRPQEDKSEKK